MDHWAYHAHSHVVAIMWSPAPTAFILLGLCSRLQWNGSRIPCRVTAAAAAAAARAVAVVYGSILHHFYQQLVVLCASDYRILLLELLYWSSAAHEQFKHEQFKHVTQHYVWTAQAAPHTRTAPIPIAKVVTLRPLTLCAVCFFMLLAVVPGVLLEPRCSRAAQVCVVQARDTQNLCMT
jgi:hypothetical protein